MRVIISGGGTGGHIFPAVAIADALKKKDANIEILFVGAEGKMEMERVPKAGYAIVGLPIVGLQRKLTIRNIWNNLFFPFKLLKSLSRAKAIIQEFKPDVVVGVGGYASGPILRVAMEKGIKGLIQEQNSYAGVTNKLLAQKAAAICVAYENMERFFPKHKIANLGNPVRRELWDNALSASEGRRFYGLATDKKTIVLIGGSLGAKSMNEAMRASFMIASQHPDIQLLWQCGKLYIDEFSQSDIAKLPNVKITPFLERMDMAYAAADVVLSRAGALSISELCLVAKPTILIPSPNVAEDHQTQNALALVRKEAAMLVKDADAKDEMLKVAFDLIKNEAKMKVLAQNIQQLAKPNAAEDIADEVLRLANL
jgi:UDP-N-acetylglucosamine--N-acetylmuramyl-(pentapeptide) pyrophosphoryl-undecaprenol N-acetylglucosamine transferase